MSFLFTVLIYFITILSVNSETISGKFHYFTDTSGKKSISDIKKLSKESFKPVQNGQINEGITTSRVWIKLDATNFERQKKTVFFLVKYAHIDQLALYELESTGNSPIYTAGDTRSFPERILKSRHLSLPITLEAFSKKSFLISAESEGPLSLPLSFITFEDFQKQDHEEQIGLGIYYGIFIVMIGYNLFLSIFVRSYSYLYYVGFITFILVFQVGLNGTGFEYIWPHNTFIQNRISAVAVCMFTFFGAIFSIRLLSLKDHSKILYRLLSGTALLGLILVLPGFYIPYKHFIKITTGLGLIFAGIAMISGSYCVHKKYRPARFYLIAWSAFMMGGILIVGRNFGILPETFLTQYGIQIGSAIEVVLLSLALADRINIMRQEKDLAERKSLENRLRMLDAFSRFVPKQFLRFLNKESIEEVKLGDSESMKVTILFNDIRGFTTISEKLSVQENFNFINTYLMRMGPVIGQHGGIVDKFIGDAIMAIFPGKTEEAVLAALDMSKELKKLNQERKTKGLKKIEMGIGIHTGNVMLGVIGSADRMDTTVIGDVVNVAARIQEMSKEFHGEILVSSEVENAVEKKTGVKFKLKGSVAIRGLSRPIKIYEVN